MKNAIECHDTLLDPYVSILDPFRTMVAEGRKSVPDPIPDKPSSDDGRCVSRALPDNAEMSAAKHRKFEGLKSSAERVIVVIDDD